MHRDICISMFWTCQGSVTEDSVASPEKVLEAKRRQVMALAYSPGKNLLSTAFMLWMSGEATINCMSCID
jgi:hypothetical protein